MPVKQMFEYKDIDGVNTTRTVMFNLTQFEIEGEMELEVIQERFQKFQDEVVGDDPNAPLREMTGPEKREILGMVKTLIKHSYGIRDGKRFIKSQDVWDEFEQTGAFSAFLYWLFSEPGRVNAFMEGIWPQGIDRPEDEPRPDLKVVTDTPDDGKSGVTVVDNTPSIEETRQNATDEPKPWYEYTKNEIDGMSDEDFDALLNRSKNGDNLPAQLLVIASQRKIRGTTE